MWYRFLRCLVIIFLVTSCSSENDFDAQTGTASSKEASRETRNEPTQPALGNTPPPSISLPCGGMTNNAAAKILNVADEQIRYSFSNELRTCTYSAGIGKSITYAIYAEIDNKTAEAEMNKVVEGLRFLVDCESMPDIGDASQYCNGDKAERLLIQKGAVWIDILTPTGLDAKIRVAEEILK